MHYIMGFLETLFPRFASRTDVRNINRNELFVENNPETEIALKIEVDNRRDARRVSVV